MGFSPGEFTTVQESGGDQFHWEAGAGTIKLWSAGELDLILVLDIEQARKASDQLALLVTMMEPR